MEEKLDKLHTRFMDAAFELLQDLCDVSEIELTQNEIEFVNAFDEYLMEMDAIIDAEKELN